jgi:hypothetical protein
MLSKRTVMLAIAVAAALYSLLMTNFLTPEEEAYRQAALVCYWTEPPPPMARPIQPDPDSVLPNEAPKYAPIEKQQQQQQQQQNEEPTNRLLPAKTPSLPPIFPPTFPVIDNPASGPQVSPDLSTPLLQPPLALPPVPPEATNDIVFIHGATNPPQQEQDNVTLPPVTLPPMPT